MRIAWFVVCCLALAGCSRAATSSLPATPEQSSSEVDARGTSRAQAAGPTYSILYTFGGDPDGANSFANLIAVDGTLYGTTLGGGTGNGTAFEITPSGTERVLATFGGSPGPSGPFAGLTHSKGAFYGTTAEGGSAGLGAVFKVEKSGKQSVLHSFGVTATDGASPYGSLTEVDGALYGTTAIGGNSACYDLGCGVIFKITPSGTESVVHTFAGEPNDGSYADAALIDVGGTLYGTTRLGGTNKLGTVFSITTSGKERVLYSFKGGSDGYYPQSTLVDVGGVLYGTTVGGGAGSAGTVFKITTSGKESVVYSFRGGSDGANPYAGLVYAKGAFYGTTYEGGVPAGFGTIFKVTASGTESVLHAFTGYPNDGEYPQASPIVLKGTLYGTTDYGSTGCVNQMGLSGCGIVFAVQGL